MYEDIQYRMGEYEVVPVFGTFCVIDNCWARM